MGQIQNSVVGAIGAVGVAARMIKHNISSSNDGQKNKEMGETATKNKDALKKSQAEFKKKVEGVVSGVNKKLTDRMEVMQAMRER